MTNPNIIDRTVVNGKYLVSTVRLAGTLRLDLYTGHIFETMVFASDAEGDVTNWQELDSQRYRTIDEARIGHNDMVQSWTDKNPKEL
jgi:hypothetical protein